MSLAVNFIDRRGPSNKMRRQLQPKKTKVMLYSLFIYIVVKDIYPLFITNKAESFNFKSGPIVWVENGKMLYQLQPKKTKVRLY